MAAFESLVELAPAREAALAATVAEQDMLYEVVAWMAVVAGGDDAPELVEIVEQDEFCNDVVVSYGELWLVYDCS